MNVMNTGNKRRRTKAILGIDTSNYRTSLCLADDEGRLLEDVRQWLPVKKGSKGLRQSEAVFEHLKQLPVLFSRMNFRDVSLAAVAVSTAPRPVEGSYMPVFKAGETLAEAIARTHAVPCYRTTHQEGHIAAGEASAEAQPQGNRFVAVHLSGGTSEMLVCTRKDGGYAIERIGGTTDLHAGQLIDRVGVALGLSFPAGPELEKLAVQASGSFTVPSSVNGYDFSFSGPASALLRAVDEGKYEHSEIARAAENCIANTLIKALQRAAENGVSREFLIVGGVAANRFIREKISRKLKHPRVGAEVFFADPVFSGDNAYGVARLGWQMHYRTNV